VLLGLGVPVAEVFYSNPMKSRAYLEYAAAKGVEWFGVDSVEEIRKVQSVKADAKLYRGSTRPTSAATGRSPASSART